MCTWVIGEMIASMELGFTFLLMGTSIEVFFNLDHPPQGSSFITMGIFMKELSKMAIEMGMES